MVEIKYEKWVSMCGRWCVLLFWFILKCSDKKSISHVDQLSHNLMFYSLFCPCKCYTCAEHNSGSQHRNL